MQPSRVQSERPTNAALKHKAFKQVAGPAGPGRRHSEVNCEVGCCRSRHKMINNINKQAIRRQPSFKQREDTEEAPNGSSLLANIAPGQPYPSFAMSTSWGLCPEGRVSKL